MADINTVRAKIQEAHDEASIVAGVPSTAQVIAALTVERDTAQQALAVATAKLNQIKAIVNA
jgi:hypothetical protein